MCEQAFTAPVSPYIDELRASIDHALAASYKRNPFDGKSVYVGHIALVKGVPFYGFHVGYALFLKVHLLNPMHMTRLADLLGEGAIMNRTFQPYESHLQYALQFMCDYNLYGCAYIDCARVQFRSPVPEYGEVGSAHNWHDHSIPAQSITESLQYPRQSHSAIEVDVCVQHILNRTEVAARPVHAEFPERSLGLGAEEKFVPSLTELWRDETRRRKLRMGVADPSSSPFPAEVLVSMSADPRNTGRGGWIHEEEFRERVKELVREERNSHGEMSFEYLASSVQGDHRVPTAAESVEELYPKGLQAGGLSSGAGVQQPPSSLEYDQDGVEELFDGLDPQGALNDCFEEVDRANEQPGLDPLTASETLRGSAESTPRSKRHAKPHEQKDAGDAESHKRRPLFPGWSTEKRPRVESSGERGHTKRVTFREKQARTEDMGRSPQKLLDESAFFPGQSSQGSVKAHSLGTAFPVVKNPHAPETNLRLSQTSQPSSQEPKSPKAKSAAPVLSSSDSLQIPWSLPKTSSTDTADDSQQGRGEAQSLVAQLSEANNLPDTTLFFSDLPPSADMVESTMQDYGLPPVIYQDAYYSDERDVPERPRNYGGREFKLQSNTVPYLPEFDSTGISPACFGEKPPVVMSKAKLKTEHQVNMQECTLLSWEIADPPPSYEEVEQWLQEEATRQDEAKRGSGNIAQQLSQIEGPTQKDRHGFKYSQKRTSVAAKTETQYMSIMSLEIHANTRDALNPDPAEDAIACVFWSFQSENGYGVGDGRAGLLCLSGGDGIAKRIAKEVSVEVDYEDDELELINKVVDLVRELDPDIMTGFEVHNGSWGYLMERARAKYEYSFCDELSRMKTQSRGRFGKDADRWGFTHTSTISVTGRHMINIWRAMRGELNLLQYTMENVVFHLLHQRIPHYSFADLTTWWTSPKPRDLAKVLDYFLLRVRLDLEILDTNETVPRTSEQARLLGVDFFSVISRGSQFKVEATMFRIAKPENFILPSPSRKQVGQQNALECLPLVMEPRSAFYNSPLVVLDFQSLYPSVMIAYNYCYSTCLGRVASWRGRNKMGFLDYQRQPHVLELVRDSINVAPNGIMYVRPEMRKSLLAKMLGELLETRAMVKSGMKADEDDKALQQLLNNRQLALKFLANVTYGYTSASFSGRMPCSEIADSIVQTGRETLERAIALIHSVERWGAEVVYGDTDSLFVYLKGRTRDQAFTIGEEIAAAVTKANPRPIKLKFEKVYHPCVLIAKKRYVGNKYETRTQQTPDFDAKGVETVRRDGTPAEQKVEEKALKIQFRSADLSEVKRYFQAQCTKILTGRISVQDFLFAREVKLGTYSDRGPQPPGALIASKRMLADARTEPQYGERVPYVVVAGAPGARLVDRCVAPEVLLHNDHMELDAEYYITKNLIPPLERIFNLVGANVRQWYDEMPKVQRMRPVAMFNARGSKTSNAPKRTLESYLQASTCILCREKLPPPPPPRSHRPRPQAALRALPLCRACRSRPSKTLLALRSRLRDQESRVANVDAVCRSCANLAFAEPIRCDSRDCPVFYTRVRERAKWARTRESVGPIVAALQGEGELDW